MEETTGPSKETTKLEEANGAWEGFNGKWRRQQGRQKKQRKLEETTGTDVVFSLLPLILLTVLMSPPAFVVSFDAPIVSSIFR